MASGKMIDGGGGGGANRNPKTFIVASGKPLKGGGGCNLKS